MQQLCMKLSGSRQGHISSHFGNHEDVSKLNEHYLLQKTPLLEIESDRLLLFRTQKDISEHNSNSPKHLLVVTVNKMSVHPVSKHIV